MSIATTGNLGLELRDWNNGEEAGGYLLSPPSEAVGLRLAGLPRFFFGAASPVFSSSRVPIQSCVPCAFLPRAPGILEAGVGNLPSAPLASGPTGGAGPVCGTRDARRGVAVSLRARCAVRSRKRSGGGRVSLRRARAPCSECEGSMIAKTSDDTVCGPFASVDRKEGNNARFLPTLFAHMVSYFGINTVNISTRTLFYNGSHLQLFITVN